MRRQSYADLLEDAEIEEHLAIFIADIGNPITAISGASEVLMQIMKRNEDSGMITGEDLRRLYDAAKILERHATQLVEFRQGVLDYLRKRQE